MSGSSMISAVGFQLQGDVVAGGEVLWKGAGRLFKLFSDGDIDVYSMGALVATGNQISLRQGLLESISYLVNRKNNRQSFIAKAVWLGWGHTEIARELTKSMGGTTAMALVAMFVAWTTAHEAAKALVALMQQIGIQQDQLPSIDCMTRIVTYLAPYVKDSGFETVLAQVVTQCSTFHRGSRMWIRNDLMLSGNCSEWAELFAQVWKASQHGESLSVCLPYRAAWFAAAASFGFEMHVVLYNDDVDRGIMWEAPGVRGQILIFMKCRKGSPLLSLTESPASRADESRLRPSFKACDVFPSQIMNMVGEQYRDPRDHLLQYQIYPIDIANDNDGSSEVEQSMIRQSCELLASQFSQIIGEFTIITTHLMLEDVIAATKDWFFRPTEDWFFIHLERQLRYFRGDSATIFQKQIVGLQLDESSFLKGARQGLGVIETKQAELRSARFREALWSSLLPEDLDLSWFIVTVCASVIALSACSCSYCDFEISESSFSGEKWDETTKLNAYIRGVWKDDDALRKHKPVLSVLTFKHITSLLNGDEWQPDADSIYERVLGFSARNCTVCYSALIDENPVVSIETPLYICKGILSLEGVMRKGIAARVGSDHGSFSNTESLVTTLHPHTTIHPCYRPGKILLSASTELRNEVIEVTFQCRDPTLPGGVLPGPDRGILDLLDAYNKFYGAVQCRPCRHSSTRAFASNGTHCPVDIATFGRLHEDIPIQGSVSRITLFALVGKPFEQLFQPSLITPFYHRRVRLCLFQGQSCLECASKNLYSELDSLDEAGVEGIIVMQ